MSILNRIKKITPKQWALVAAGGGAAALAANYFYAKDNSIVSRLVRSVRGGSGGVPSGMQAHSAPMPLPLSAVFVETTMPPEVYAPTYGGVPHFAHYYSPHGVTHNRHHIVGAPKAHDGIKSNVPPPGSRGVVSVTPPASTDPGQPPGADPMQPCGPGLYYEPAAQRCVPYPTTPPVAPYGYE